PPPAGGQGAPVRRGPCLAGLGPRPPQRRAGPARLPARAHTGGADEPHHDVPVTAVPVAGAVALRPDTDVRLQDDATVITLPYRRIALRGLGPRVTDLLAGLRDRPATVDALADRLAEGGGSSTEIATLYLALDR